MSRFCRMSTATTSRISVKSALALTGRLSASRISKATLAPFGKRAPRQRRERDDRAMRREIVGGAADRRRDEDAVAHQLVEADDAVDADADLRCLARLA